MNLHDLPPACPYQVLLDYWNRRNKPDYTYSHLGGRRFRIQDNRNKLIEDFNLTASDIRYYRTAVPGAETIPD